MRELDALKGLDIFEGSHLNHVTFVTYEKDFWVQRIVFRHLEVVFSAYCISGHQKREIVSLTHPKLERHHLLFLSMIFDPLTSKRTLVEP